MWAFNSTTNLILKLMGYSLVEDHEAAHTDNEIKLLVEESYKHGLIEKSEYTSVDNITRLMHHTWRLSELRPDYGCKWYVQ
jgi:Hemolysins and related proteins containing CBS domains